MENGATIGCKILKISCQGAKNTGKIQKTQTLVVARELDYVFSSSMYLPHAVYTNRGGDQNETRINFFVKCRDAAI